MHTNVSALTACCNSGVTAAGGAVAAAGPMSVSPLHDQGGWAPAHHREATWGPKYICNFPQTWCPQNLLALLTSAVSMACVGVVLCRLYYRRLRKLPRPDTAIGRLIEYLVSASSHASATSRRMMRAYYNISPDRRGPP
jgi:hypothetical protein